jgi:hypothetical protein
MSTTQYRCEKRERRQAVLEDGVLNGIDFVEVATADQLELTVGLLQPAAGLVPANVVVTGGERVTGIVVTSVTGQPGKKLTVTVSERGDFSLYELRLVAGPGEQDAPAGFDPQLSSVRFSFKVACPNPFDCGGGEVCAPAAATELEVDYLAKDYSSFRRIMLDRLSVLLPDWRERNPADALITLVELLAYAGDHLSYTQDAAATEAYLGTARSRISLRRHSRLLDYALGEGCNARAFVALTVAPAADGQVLPGPDSLLGRPGTAIVTRLPQSPTLIKRLPDDLEHTAVVFETLHDLRLIVAHDTIEFHTWSDSECCLPKGATRATLKNDAGLALVPGDLLLLEEIAGPVTGLAVDADPAHRHVVRLETVKLGPGVKDPLDGRLVAEVTWRAEDALPFPLCLSSRTAGGVDPAKVVTVAVARGNVVLADHGRTLEDGRLLPPVAPSDGSYRPALPVGDLTFAVPYDHEATLVKDALTGDLVTVQPAASAFRADAARAVPALRLVADETWEARSDLLSSGRSAAEFVVEVERDGIAHLRFGDGRLGKQPAPGTELAVTLRTGGGVAGNLGAEALRHVVAPLLAPGGITAVRNPLPAAGGTAPESFEQARQFAPQAFRRQERAVTEADWVDVAMRFPGGGIQRAAARFRWTGSWHTVFVTVDRVGGASAARDPAFKTALRAHLERYRLAGYDLEVADPVHVPLDLRLLVCVKSGYFRSDVLAELRKAFGSKAQTDGTLGFFHPDRFTFGQPLYLSRVYEAALRVSGVTSVQVKRFRRWGRAPNYELENAVITAAGLEILRLDGDPNFPENGRIEFEMNGGL